MKRWTTLVSRCTIGLLTVLLAVVLAQVMLSRPEGLPRPLGEGELAAQTVALSGVKNPVTAVLLNFRAYDTLLELGVLALAVLGVRAAIGDPRHWSAMAVVSVRHSSDLLPQAAVIATLPVLILLSGELLWIGADFPGGAFQAGAVLGGGGVLLVLLGRMPARMLSGWPTRLLVSGGVGVFLAVGIATVGLGLNFLQYPPGYSKLLILAIETAAMLMVADVFVMLFCAEICRPVPPRASALATAGDATLPVESKRADLQ